MEHIINSSYTRGGQSKSKGETLTLSALLTSTLGMTTIWSDLTCPKFGWLSFPHWLAKKMGNNHNHVCDTWPVMSKAEPPMWEASVHVNTPRELTNVGTCMGISLPHGLERGYQPRPLGMIKFQCTIAFPIGIVEELFPKALLVELQKEKANQAFSPTFCGSSFCFSNVFHHLQVDASISRYFSKFNC